MGVKWFVTSYLSLYYFHQNSATLKVPNINSVRQSHAFLPAIVRSQKSPKYQVPLTPQLPSFVDDWGTSQQSMFGLDRFLKRRHQNGKLQGFQGLGDVKCGGKIFFLLSDSSDIVLFHYFFTLWQTCWSLSFPKTKWLICINIRYKITDRLVLNQAHDEITRFFFF